MEAKDAKPRGRGRPRKKKLEPPDDDSHKGNGGPKTKRKRRTKAQMAADRAAKEEIKQGKVVETPITVASDERNDEGLTPE